MIEHSAEIEKLAQALHAAQGLIEGVAKDRVNPHFKNRYATLEAVIEAAKPALQGHGIAFTQAPGALVDGAVEITTMLLHASGQWMRSTLHVPLGKRDAQGVGSAITYGCRYALMATLGLPPVDDDGEAASRPAPARKVEEPFPAGGEGGMLDFLIAQVQTTKTEYDIDGLLRQHSKAIKALDPVDYEKFGRLVRIKRSTLLGVPA